jgi:predicted peptidase
MQSRQRPIIGKQGYDYLLYLPKEYDRRNDWPFILFLHGASEKGSDLDRLKTTGLPKRLDETDDFPFIVISPQCPRGFYWSAKLIADLLDDVVGSYKVDETRIYLTGISMGGYATWEVAIDQPWRFAAIAPICGGGNPRLAHKIKDLPVWVFHGAMDEIVPVSESEVMVDALERIQGDVRFTVYPDLGHDSWTETYNDPELYQWFQIHYRKTCLECPGGYERFREELRPGI